MDYRWIIIFLLPVTVISVSDLPSSNNSSSLSSTGGSTTTAPSVTITTTTSVATQSKEITTTPAITTALSATNVSEDSNSTTGNHTETTTQLTSTFPTTTVTVTSTISNETTENSTSYTTQSSTSTNQTVPESTASTEVYISPTTPTTTVPPFLKVMISETNLLLTDPDSGTYFVELQINQTVGVDEVWLVIRNAALNTTEKPLLSQHLNISKNHNGLFTYTASNESEPDFWTAMKNVESVLIGLYAEERFVHSFTEDGLYDILIYSSHGDINDGLREELAHVTESVIIDYKKFENLQPVSLSRCSTDDIATISVVLTNQTLNETNLCNFTVNQPLEMQLTSDSPPCPKDPPTDLTSQLSEYIVFHVNSEERCGFAVHMLSGMKTKTMCISEKEEIEVEFTVRSVFKDQMLQIMNGYQSAVLNKSLKIGNARYFSSSCYENCFHGGTPPVKTNDNRLRVTVAVVVSCIAIFLIVLLFVILYLRKKKKHILQFRMSRLDEDNDLIGDMDDFVGNQGPTFRSFR